MTLKTQGPLKTLLINNTSTSPPLVNPYRYKGCCVKCPNVWPLLQIASNPQARNIDSQYRIYWHCAESRKSSIFKDSIPQRMLHAAARQRIADKNGGIDRSVTYGHQYRTTRSLQAGTKASGLHWIYRNLLSVPLVQK